jgi:DNA-binding transcriptional LysR family regulator
MLHDVHFAELDLNLLRVLDALLETRSVTLAAHRLHLSPSATSHALGRLRESFGDALLVRSAGGLVPTLRAEALAGPVRAALGELQRAVAMPLPFDPSTAARSFAVGSADYSDLVLLPAMLAHLAEHAKGIDLVARNAGPDPIEPLLRGEFDVVIGPDVAANDRPGVRARTLFADRFVCLVRRDHPAIATRWTAQRFAGLRHAFIAPRGRPGGVVDTALAALGLSRRVVLMVQHFLAAPFVVAKTDLVLTVPERVAFAFADMLPLAIVPPPMELPGFTMQLLWHDRTHDDPAHRWLRQLVIETAEKAAPGSTKGVRRLAEIREAAAGSRRRARKR